MAKIVAQHDDLGPALYAPVQVDFKIVTADGAKGGTGKSLTATLQVDSALIEVGPQGRVILIEGDVTNPDVATRWEHHPRIDGFICDLRREEEWPIAFDKLDEFAELHRAGGQSKIIAVINLPATARLEDKAYSFASTLDALNAKLYVLWVMEGEIEFVNLLQRSRETGLISVAHQYAVVLNGRFGKQHDFFVYNNSALRAEIQNDPRYRSDIWIAKLDPAAHSKFKESGLPPRELLQAGGMRVGTRTDFLAWLNVSEASLAKGLAE